MSLAICAYVLLINAVTFAAFARDKRAAIKGEWRVRESTLLWLATFGGFAGAVLAQSILRHKTRKEPFRTYLYVIACVELFFIGILLLPPVRDLAPLLLTISR